MSTILQLSLYLDKLKRSAIYVDDFLLPQNVMFPLPTCLHDGIHLFIIGGVFLNCIKKRLTLLGHTMPLLNEHQ